MNIMAHDLDYYYIIVKSFYELGPHLIKTTGNYLLSEVFSQDPLERYFSRQRNRAGADLGGGVQGVATPPNEF